MNTTQLIGLGIGILVALVVNFIPSGIAFARSHPERHLIGKLNILSIFSFLLWFALLAWAVGGQRNDSIINRFVGKVENRNRLFAVVALLVGLGVASTAYALSQS